MLLETLSRILKRNMDYNVIMTPNALEDLDGFVQYLLLKKHSRQAARNLLEDTASTIDLLSSSAESFHYCVNPNLRAQGYRRINLSTHSYFMLYRVEGSNVSIDDIFHELQDYENKMR